MSLLALRINSVTSGASLGPGGTPSCLLWLTSDKISPSAPEVVEVDSNNAVEKWIDQSGSGNDVFSTTGFEPVLNAASVDCDGIFRDTIQFNGIDQFFSLSPFLFSGVRRFSVFIVFRAGDNESTLMSFRDTETGVLTDGVSVSMQPSALFSQVETDVETRVVGRSGVYNTGEVVLVEVFLDLLEASDELRLRFNGSEATEVSIGGTSVIASSNEINIGRFGTGGQYYPGDMAEIVVFGDDDDTTRTTVENYLFAKWCISPVGAGPGGTRGTYWWYCVKHGLPFIDDGQGFLLDEWEDNSGRRLIAAQRTESLRPFFAQQHNNGIGGINMGSSIIGGAPYILARVADTQLETLGALHNLDEITAFSIIFVSSEGANPEIPGNIFAWGDGGDRQIVLRLDSTSNDASIALKTPGNPPVLSAISPVWADGRQLNDSAAPNSRFVLSLKILTVNVLAGVALWYKGFPSETSLLGSTTIFLPPLGGSTLDVGNTLRMSGTFPGTTFEGSGGQYFVTEMAFYDHALDATERQQVMDYFTSVYNTGPRVKLHQPFQTNVANQVAIPWVLMNANDSGHIVTSGSGPAFFRDTVPSVVTSPATASNPLFRGVDNTNASGFLEPFVFLDTVPGPGTYFYRGQMAEDSGLALPVGFVQYETPTTQSNEVSIIVV